jgi:hypothetical protein
VGGFGVPLLISSSLHPNQDHLLPTAVPYALWGQGRKVETEFTKQVYALKVSIAKHPQEEKKEEKGEKKSYNPDDPRN